ncbi:MAG: Fic family protein, partial [Deltaproteobacteria bacterium]|nr:Fic family protein [Deltaproteobacteria bacterium]
MSTIPYQRSWAEELQAVQLKREIAGTSRIEGADFTDVELDKAMSESPSELFTRSQRQAAASKRAYRWIAKLPDDYPLGEKLIREIHRLIVTDADDDHCPPGVLRKSGQNVNFGVPLHRGVEGGGECIDAFHKLCQAIKTEFQQHDPLIQALALHYHLAAMHPFLDGNGRTARALEALMLQKTGLRDILFIAMSNYYYEEKNTYLKTLAEVHSRGYDLTPFLNFGLKGIELQCRRLFEEIRKNVSKALFRNVMYDLFNRLQTPKKRVIVRRQLEILKILLSIDSMDLSELERRVIHHYEVKNPYKAFIRDCNHLLWLKAIGFERV